MKFPIYAAFKETYSYLGDNALRIARVAWPAIVILLVWGLWFITETNDIRDHLKAVARTGDKAQYYIDALPLYVWQLCNTAVSVVLGSVIAAALLRPMLRGGWNPDTDFLDLGRDELRLMGGLAAVNCIGLIVFIAQTFTNYSAGAGVILAAVISLWLYARLSVVQPAAVDGYGIGVARSFALTRGNFWRLSGFALLVTAPLVTVVMVMAMVATMLGLARNVHSGAIMFPESRAWLSMLVLMVIGTFGPPLGAVATGIAYRLLSEQRSAADIAGAAPSQPG